jgi:hypothetical protein
MRADGLAQKRQLEICRLLPQELGSTPAASTNDFPLLNHSHSMIQRFLGIDQNVFVANCASFKYRNGASAVELLLGRRFDRPSIHSPRSLVREGEEELRALGGKNTPMTNSKQLS